MDKHKISISFKTDYLHIYHYLKQQNNISAYICKLVQADMQSTPPTNWEAQVKELIAQALQNAQLNISPDSSAMEDILTNDELDLINNLF